MLDERLRRECPHRLRPDPHADPVLLRTVALSLARQRHVRCCSPPASALALGAWLAVARFPGHRLLVLLLNTLLALPSVVVGLVVYLLLSRSGPLGSLGHPVHADARW